MYLSGLFISLGYITDILNIKIQDEGIFYYAHLYFKQTRDLLHPFTMRGKIFTAGPLRRANSVLKNSTTI